MKLTERFEAYAADFERSLADDDWTRLERHFTEDAVYSTPANGLRVSGRADVLAVLRAAVAGFDRRCDTRSLVTTEGPHQENNDVLRKWAARFTLAGAPDLEIDGSERARFRDERIELLEVTLTPETLLCLMNYSERYLR